jgi:hypothetical protein
MAAKRYYEGRGNASSSKRMSNMDGNFSPDFARRTQEMQDKGMFDSDFSKTANMPEGSRYIGYPKVNYNMNYDLDDSIIGVDNQMNQLDGAQLKRYMKPKKV